MRGGMVILDIADKHHPRHVATLSVYPPLGSTIAVHSAVPLPGRDVVVINDEALREYCDEPASYAATVDISDESDPILILKSRMFCNTLFCRCFGVFWLLWEVRVSWARLTFTERAEIARLHEEGRGVRAIARVVERAPSTISRELKRNTSPSPRRYRAFQAHILARERGRRGSGRASWPPARRYAPRSCRCCARTILRGRSRAG
jgi:hypothetical protein